MFWPVISSSRRTHSKERSTYSIQNNSSANMTWHELN